jgi:proteasome lid subunit RPN8/RPN11
MNGNNMKIKVAEPVFDYICRQVDYGYEAPYKQERFGFLYGKRSKSGLYWIKGCHFYKGGTRKRSYASFVIDDVINRGTELAKRKRMQWIGIYHSHVEVDGEIYYGLSEHDKEPKPFLPVELLIAVWPNGTNGKHGHLRKRFKILDTHYQYLFSGYIREGRNLHLVKLEQVAP